MEKIVIFGSGGHARVIADIIEKEGKYEIIGFLDDNENRIGKKELGYKILGKIKEFPELNAGGGIIAIGDNWVRNKVQEKIKEINPLFKFIKAVHPSTNLGKNTIIGDGTVVMANVNINPNTKIGAHCILNTCSSIDHDSIMEDYSSLAPGAVTGGEVKIGRYSAISIGATLKHQITIGEHSIIGAGAIVLKDVPKNTVVYGVPAKVIREREIGEKYL